MGSYSLTLTAVCGDPNTGPKVGNDTVVGANVDVIPKPEAFYLKSEDVVNNNAHDNSYEPLTNDRIVLGNVPANMVKVKLSAGNSPVDSLTLENGTITVTAANKFEYQQTKAWTKTERFRYSIQVGAKHRDVEDYVTSGFRYEINEAGADYPGNFDDKDLSKQGIQADGGLVLAGGGLLLCGDPSQETNPTVQADKDIFGWIANHAKGGDFVLMRGANTSEEAFADPTWFNCDPEYGFFAGHPFDSVEALNYVYKCYGGGAPTVQDRITEAQDPINILARAMASDWFAKQKLNGAEAIFFGGGDQWRYIANWIGTEVETTAMAKYAGGHTVLAGTSAGLAIMGDWDYATKFGAATPQEALDSPHQYNESNGTGNPLLTFERNFVRPAHLTGVVTDSHFGSPSLTPSETWGNDGNRGRMGRLVAFVANMGKDTGSAKGLGVDATTALMVETTGMAKVFGMFNVYFVTPTEAAAVDANGNLVDPLTMNNIKVRRVDKDTAPFQLADGWNASSVFGLQYSLTARPKQGEPLQGELVSDRPNGEVY